MGLEEMDLPAAHGSVILRIATKRDLPREELREAFQDAEHVKAYRSHADFAGVGLGPSDVKLAVSMLTYGSNLKSWLSETRVTKIPAKLERLKANIQGVVDHLAGKANAAAIRFCQQHRQAKGKDPEGWPKTLLSIHCQHGERWMLTKCEEVASATILGYLGDSFILEASSVDIEAVKLKCLQDFGISIDAKPLPKSALEYFAMVEKATGTPISTAQIPPRVKESFDAGMDAAEWLSRHVQGQRQGPCPDLKFAKAVEESVMLHLNRRSGKLEYYDVLNGVWIPTTAGATNDERLAKILIDKFLPKKFQLVEIKGRLKLRYTKDRNKAVENYFSHHATSTGISLFLQRLCRDFGFELDQHPDSNSFLNLQGKYMLDFSVGLPDLSWATATDEEIDEALHRPLRASVPEDRVTRIANCAWKKFDHPDRFKLFRAIARAQECLKTHDTLDEDSITALDNASGCSVVLTKGFRDPHHDWDTAHHHARLFFEPISNTGKRVQIVNLRDDGAGSTGKGTTRQRLT
jgi:hypothetical protein